MTRKNGYQNFSLRRIFLQRTQGNRSNIGFGDIERGTSLGESIDERNSTTGQSITESSSNDAECAKYNEDDRNCIICFSQESDSNPFYTLELCTHRFCISCLIQYLKIEISDSRTDIACPQCSSGIHPNNIELILTDFPRFISKYEDFMIRRYLVADPDTRWCPRPDCSYAVIATGCASCPQLKCERPNCGVSFCYHCKSEWHPDQTCDAARSLRQSVVRVSSIRYSQDSTRRDEIKSCPRCQVLIVKMNDGSCNHMICSVCGAEFCWLCMKEVSDLHYLSPSGCTFWGKKPWSRKKKIVWQIGTLIGAPVGIALLAGIAVPSMVIGIPVWVGRKLFDRYKSKTKKKRNISITIGVAVSVLISPLLAGLAIAIGIPILLFYVYGIVPVSLCRAGCGTSANEEYKLYGNKDEEVRAQCNIDEVSMDIMYKIGEASIGEVSLSATSCSAIEIVNNNTMQNTQPSCRESTIALAGSLSNQRVECIDNVLTDCSKSSSQKSVNLKDSIKT